MNWIKIVTIILKMPMIIFILASFIGACYAAANSIQNIGWETPIILALLIVSYLIGAILNYLYKE